MISFLKIVTFAVIYLKLVDIMGMFILHYEFTLEKDQNWKIIKRVLHVI